MAGAVFIVLAASLIGASGGFLIADHAEVVGRLKSLTGSFTRHSPGADIKVNKPPVTPAAAPITAQAPEVESPAVPAPDTEAGKPPITPAAAPKPTEAPEAKTPAAPAPDTKISKPPVAPAAAPKATDVTEAMAPVVPPPDSGLIGEITCTHQQDAASVNVTVGDVVVVRADRLHAPERIYFDLRDSGRAEGTPGKLLKMKTVPLNDPLVSGVRVAWWESGAARVVVDLKRPCEYSYRLSPKPSSSLVVDLRPSVPVAR